MSYKAILLLIVSSLILSGCSFLKRFKAPYKTNNPVSVQPIEYRFLEPRRQSLDPKTSASLKQADSNSGLKYYSASGYECKTLSLNPTASACLINNRWLAAAPVLIANIP